MLPSQSTVLLSHNKLLHLDKHLSASMGYLTDVGTWNKLIFIAARV